jgi:hypothetical protein
MRLLPALCAVLCAGCIVVIEGPDGGQSDGGGSNVDGGVVSVPPGPPADPPDSGPPPDGGAPAPGLAILWVVRLNQATPGLAGPIGDAIVATTDALQAAGANVTSEGMLPLQGGDLIWAWAPQADQTLQSRDLASVITDAAAKAPAALACSTNGLFAAGRNLWNLSWGGVGPFSMRPGALLVIFVDPAARPAPEESTACWTSGPPSLVLAGSPLAYWATFFEGPLERRFTRVWALATLEGATAAQLRADCLDQPDFPSGALDFLEPSAVPFYGALQQRASALAPDLVTSVDLCAALGSGWKQTVADLAAQWAAEAQRP